MAWVRTPQLSAPGMQDEWRSDGPLGQLWASIMLRRVPVCNPRLVRSLQRCPWRYVPLPQTQSGACSSGGAQRAKGTGASPRTAPVMRAMCVGLSSQHGLCCSTTSPQCPLYPIFRLMSCMTVWPGGIRRWLQAPVRKGVGSNPKAVTAAPASCPRALRVCLLCVYVLWITTQ